MSQVGAQHAAPQPGKISPQSVFNRAAIKEGLSAAAKVRLKKRALQTPQRPIKPKSVLLTLFTALIVLLAFFLHGSSFCSSADGRRCRRLITKLEVYERATRVSRSIRSASRKISLLRRGAGNFAGVIAVARLDGEPFAFHADLQLMDLRGTIRASGYVRERVLVPRFFADARVKLLQCFALGRKINLTAG